MGIKGLTTYIANKSEYCMEDYQLHDTNVVIDGDAVLCQLYLVHTTPRNGCFGGDYDKYGNTIYKFFHTLFQCKIKPYIILDGGYESRKMDRINERFKDRIRQVECLDARSNNRNHTTPLFIREAFEDIALKLGVKLIRCDFEGDRETANIAKALNCPVISNDSDFYIYDIPYIPFPSVDLSVKSYVDANTSYKYISCKIYIVDKFLKCIGGLSKDLLPLFAALVGNDFINEFNLSKIGVHTNCNNMQKIDNIIKFLLKETKESALDKVLSMYKDNERDCVLKKLEDAINGYNFDNSKYLKYLIDGTDDNIIDNDNINDYNAYDKLTVNFPEPFLENFRKSLYPTRFMDILTQNKYYNFRPQVEVEDYDQAHDVSINIMSAIHKILTNNSPEKLKCLVRHKSKPIEIELPLCNLDLPTYSEIQQLNADERKNTLLKILEIDDKFVNQSLNEFPPSWQLLIITLKYMMNNSTIVPTITYSIILCKLVIDYIDPKIGFFRSTTLFNKQFYSKIKHILSIRNNVYPNTQNLKTALSNITFNDSLVAMSRLVPFFDFDRKLMRDSRLYDRRLMHCLSQFQSCLLHVKCLNQLLNMAYQDFFITECYNGTFVYNMTFNLKRRDDLDDYLRYLLTKSPLFLHSFELIIKLLKGI